MAFIPDTAIDAFAELSKGARLYYIYLARCRNQKTGACHPSVHTTSAALGIRRNAVYVLRRELTSKKWAQFNNDQVNRLYGFCCIKNQLEDSANTALNLIEPPQIMEKEDSIKNNTNSIKNDTNSIKNNTPVMEKEYKVNGKMILAYKEEPAKEPAKGTSKELLGEFVDSLSQSAPAEPAMLANLWFEIFAVAFVAKYTLQAPQCKAGFVQLARLRREQGAELTEEKWQKGVTNYFATPLGQHTLADLCVRFASFCNHPLDRFGKPIEAKASETFDPMQEIYRQKWAPYAG